MKNHEKNCKLYLNMVENPEDWKESLRHNLFTILESDGVTIQKLADIAGINYETMKSVLYGNSKDYKVGVLINIAKHFGLTLDELIGAGTCTEEQSKANKLLRQVPAHIAFRYNWILDIVAGRTNDGQELKSIPYIVPEIRHSGNLQPIYDANLFDVSSLRPEIRAKAMLAVRFPTDYYMPSYTPYDVLILANDRKPRPSEDCVVLYNGFVWIGRLMERDGVEGIYSIRDGEFRCAAEHVESIFGYVASVVHIEKR